MINELGWRGLGLVFFGIFFLWSRREMRFREVKRTLCFDVKMILNLEVVF